jgi:hypothetical protein
MTRLSAADGMGLRSLPLVLGQGGITINLDFPPCLWDKINVCQANNFHGPSSYSVLLSPQRIVRKKIPNVELLLKFVRGSGQLVYINISP